MTYKMENSGLQTPQCITFLRLMMCVVLASSSCSFSRFSRTELQSV